MQLCCLVEMITCLNWTNSETSWQWVMVSVCGVLRCFVCGCVPEPFHTLVLISPDFFFVGIALCVPRRFGCHLWGPWFIESRCQNDQQLFSSHQSFVFMQCRDFLYSCCYLCGRFPRWCYGLWQYFLQSVYQFLFQPRRVSRQKGVWLLVSNSNAPLTRMKCFLCVFF